MRQRLQWTYNRLKLMNVLEIVFRVNRYLGQIYEKNRISKGWRPKPRESIRFAGPLFPFDKEWTQHRHSIKAQERYALDRLLHGSIDLLGVSGLSIGRPTNWHREPFSGKLLPKIYGKSIDYRNPEQVGNIKFIWELGRHQHLVPVALAYAVSGQTKDLDYCLKEIENFIEQNPFGLGVHWCSALEVGLRVLSWCFVYSFIALRQGRDELNNPQLLPAKAKQSIFEHVWFIRNFLSRYSSANNHLIGELTCIWVACNVFDLGKDGLKWKLFAHEQLEMEASKQNFVDGVNKEQSTYYHYWVLEYLFLAYLVSVGSGTPFTDEFYQRIIKMSFFLEAIQDRCGNMPQFGDSDDGVASVFALCQKNNPIDHIVRAVRIFHEGSEEDSDHKAYWYTSIAKKKINYNYPVYEENKLYPLSFNHGGYFILGTQECHIVFKCGPFGHLSIAAHAHADAHSVYVSIHCREFLIDPGTYAYHTKQKWRNYFRGTSAHNTVRVDCLDQSVIGGNFMWLKKANAWCEGIKSDMEKDSVSGMHDGYLRLKDPVLHKRNLELDKNKGTLIIEDHLECKDRHDIERFWHFSEDCLVWQVKDSIWAENNGVKICLQCSDAELELVRGQEDPPLGWVSRRFDYKVPSWTGVARNNIHGDAKLRTLLQWDI